MQDDSFSKQDVEFYWLSLKFRSQECDGAKVVKISPDKISDTFIEQLLHLNTTNHI